MRWVIIAAVFLATSPALAQHKVVLSSEQSSVLGLPPSDYYVVYTSAEYSQLKGLYATQQKIIDKLKLVVEFQQENIASLKLSQSLLQEDLKHWRKYGTSMFDRWEKCDLKMRQATAWSWVPWVVTSVALVSTTLAASFAVYYRQTR